MFDPINQFIDHLQSQVIPMPKEGENNGKDHDAALMNDRQMMINNKDNFDSIPEDTTTDRPIEQAPIFDELAKQINVPAPLPT